MTTEGKAALLSVQGVLDRLAGLFGRDVRARGLMDSATRAATGKSSRRSVALSNLAPGTTAEALRRSIAEQRQRKQETP